MKRIDGRPYNYLRKVKITPNYLSHPAGSALIEMGGTKVICAVSVEPGVKRTCDRFPFGPVPIKWHRTASQAHLFEFCCHMAAMTQ